MRSVASSVLVCVALSLVWACGSVAPDGGFSSELDTDQGLGESPGDSVVQGDPCAGDIPWDCNPLTNEGCTGDGGTPLTCAYFETPGYLSKKAGFTCYGGATAGVGESCDAETGPWCTGGLYCSSVSGLCSPFCCGDAECSPPDECLVGEFLGVGDSFGYCTSESPDGGPTPDAG